MLITLESDCIFGSRALLAIFLTEWHHLGMFGRGHYEEDICEICVCILPVVQEQMLI